MTIYTFAKSCEERGASEVYESSEAAEARTDIQRLMKAGFDINNIRVVDDEKCSRLNLTFDM